MANPEHLAILDQGVEVWNKWREENPSIIPDLSGADLSNRNFTQSTLSFKAQIRRILYEAKLLNPIVSLFNRKVRIALENGIDFTGANLRGANFSKAILIGTNFGDAILMEANLERAALPWSVLVKANLMHTRFDGAILSYSRIDRAQLFTTKFNNTSLRGASFEKSTFYEVEFIGANLARADFSLSHFFDTNFTDAIIYGVDFRGANLIRAKFPRAKMAHCKVYGISTWEVDTDQAIQSDLEITDTDSSSVPITVDNIELAQFIYLLLKNQKIRSVIDTITSKVVLVLGRFTPERKQVLDAIKEELRKRDYVPVMFDFEKPVSRNFTETVNILAHLARFVIADLTEPRSIPQELTSVGPFLTIPVVPILKEDSEPWAMFQDFSIKNGVLNIVSYRDITDLLANFNEKVIQPAEQKAQELIVEKGRPLLYPKAGA